MLAKNPKLGSGSKLRVELVKQYQNGKSFSVIWQMIWVKSYCFLFLHSVKKCLLSRLDFFFNG